MVILNTFKMNKYLKFIIREGKIKVQASTIVETLIASIIIIIIFSIASMTLNNLFKSSVYNDTASIETHLGKLQYLQLKNKLSFPYNENYQGWSIIIKEINENHKQKIVFEALNDNKQLTKTISNVGF